MNSTSNSNNHSTNAQAGNDQSSSPQAARDSLTGLPKNIWMFWDKGEINAPPMVHACIKSWRQHHPDWQVHVLEKTTLQNYADMQVYNSRSDIGLQAHSDILRLKLLANHGGIWADATLFCAAPLETWLPKYFQNDFFAFESIKPDRWMTSWFLAAKQESELLHSWLRAMEDYWGNTKFQQTTYWKKQLIRRITSLRRRSMLSNDVWFSSLFSRFLKVYPYPVAMYLFERALKADGLENLWKSRLHFSDEQPEYLQNVLKLQNPVTSQSKAFIQSNKTPMHKLNWRLGDSLSNPDSNLHFLLKHAGSQ